MSDNKDKTQRIFSEEEVNETLHELGYKEREHDVPWYRKLKCRVLGPHEWVPIHSYDLVTSALTEHCCICDVCGKES